jgi:AcrR family transcriptional regulator
MTESGDPDVDAILEIFEAMHAEETPEPNEGLRERKKRRLRQKISDVATAMFLVHGFDKVTVAQIAAACEVAEQTLFNYFPNKESMFLDRSESMTNAVADAVRGRRGSSLVEAVVQAQGDGMHPGRSEALDEDRQLHLFRLFCEVVNGSPALASARLAESARFTDEVSVALAERIGADPIDPEVQLATFVIAGLVRVRMQSTFRHVQHATSFAAFNDAVHRDLLGAAQLAEPSLTAFDNLRKTADDSHDDDRMDKVKRSVRRRKLTA